MTRMAQEEADEAERARVAERLRRIREQVRDAGRDEAPALPPPRPLRPAERHPPEPAADSPAPPSPPDGRAVNELWTARPTSEPGGLRGALARALRRLLEPSRDAQVAFNSKQVQLDNELLAWIEARFAHTHRHYDAVLGGYGRHLTEIDERHMILQEELVAHVHDLVHRIDLVLGESEKGRLALEHALKDVRARLARLEERLKTE
jgi:hypothetical protein